MNATDIYGDDKRSVYLAKEVDKFKSYGLVSEELDLREYFDNDRLADQLSEYGAVWVMGGNSFVLRRAMRYSAFDKLILPLVESEDIVYAGFSAGSVVAAPSLKGIGIVDDPNKVPENYDKKVIWGGLGFVDFSIAPHFRAGHPESAAIDEVVSYFQAQDMPYKAINDNQAIVVNNDKIEIVG